MRKTFALASVLFLAAAAHADVELTLRTTRAKGTATTSHVTLGSTWFRVDDGNDSVTYDFTSRRIVHVDKAAHRLDDDSLFGDVDGRQRELENRAFLGRALEAGEVKDNPMALTLAEHQTSIRGDAARASGIEARSDDGGHRFVWKGKELMAWSSELLPVKAAERDRFVSFVRYRVGGHPEILADLQRADGIPKWLRFSPQLGDEKTRIDVAGIAQKPDAPPPAPPSDAKEVFDDPRMAVARMVTPASRDAAVAAIVAEASAAADAQKPLQALLGYLETTLVVRRELPPEFIGHRESIAADADVQAFLGAMNPQSQEAATTAIKTLARLQLAAGPKAYVVSIFRANVETGLGDTEGASRDFHAALAKNALITGVWKDLGDLLAREFRSTEAWRYYDTARRIAPEHSMLKSVNETQARLLREHPEFF